MSSLPCTIRSEIWILCAGFGIRGPGPGHVLEINVADPGPGSGALLTPGSGMNIPDHISVSLETIFWVKNT
jgi:hypothetical protein